MYGIIGGGSQPNQNEFNGAPIEGTDKQLTNAIVAGAASVTCWSNESRRYGLGGSLPHAFLVCSRFVPTRAFLIASRGQQTLIFIAIFLENIQILESGCGVENNHLVVSLNPSGMS